jgi:2-iminobutanoate/2-iminopropanoate deaminase
MIQIVHSPSAPEAIGPYSQAIIAAPFLFCSGQIGLDPAMNALVEGVENQTRQALVNMEAILVRAGFSPGKVAKTTIFLKRMEDFAVVNTVYGDFFGEHRPARSTVEVSNLPKGALVEIECIAVL